MAEGNARCGDPLTDPNDTCKWKISHTEYLDKYVPNKQRAPLNTRQMHMDCFLYSEMAKAYIIQERKIEDMENNAAVDSEYGERFHKPPLDHSKEDEAVQKMYPLYGTRAITFWCPSNLSKIPYKLSNCLTKLNAECYDQQFR